MSKLNYVDLKGNESDDELRAKTRRCLNGEYALSICRRCGYYTQSPNGDINTAKIFDGCRECWSSNGVQDRISDR